MSTSRSRPGERVALVGENGAGKTTITKLLARLYDPSEGRILLDGVDLREYDLASVRAAIGVIFQDFVRYDMRFDENVGVGEVEAVRGYLDAMRDAQPGAPMAPPQRSSTRRSARSPRPSCRASRGGYRQMLGRRFDDGVDLSGGEWQKVALARAYMRDAQVLILDEPTAALDARAEYEVFVRFNRADGRPDGGRHLAPLLHGAHGRPHHRAERTARSSSRARTTTLVARRRAVRGAVRDAGEGYR